MFLKQAHHGQLEQPSSQNRQLSQLAQPSQLAHSGQLAHTSQLSHSSQLAHSSQLTHSSQLVQLDQLEESNQYGQRSDSQATMNHSSAVFEPHHVEESSQRSITSSFHTDFSQDSPVITVQFPELSSSESRCCVCKSKTGRMKVPRSAALSLLFQHQIHMPDNNRTCASHVENGLFTDAAIASIRTTKDSFQISGQEVTELFREVAKQKQNGAPLNFENLDQHEDEDIQIHFGITKEDFRYLLPYCRLEMRDSDARTVSNALAMFLMVLRHNTCQKVKYAYFR